MIPEEHKHNIIQTGIAFMRSITEAYGTDEGMKLWETISSTLDADVKGQIFFALITGQYDDTIYISHAKQDANKISMIKAIRVVTGAGLKEAKDIVDEFVGTGRPLKLKCTPSNRDSNIRELRNAGFYI